jgi:hypothetical protein
VILNILRKFQWDVIHNNLLDLEDEIGGSILRKGFLSRPVFTGKYEGSELTINFSQERIKNKRLNYINVSMNIRIKNSLTIISLDWLKDKKESTDDLEIVNIDESSKYGIRKSSSKNIFKKDSQKKIKQLIAQLHPFTYIFVGQTGIIFEKDGENLAITTKKSLLLEIINLLLKMGKTLQ